MSTPLPLVPRTPSTARYVSSSSGTGLPAMPYVAVDHRPNSRVAGVKLPIPSAPPQVTGSPLNGIGWDGSWGALPTSSSRVNSRGRQLDTLTSGTLSSKPHIVTELELFIEKELLHLSKHSDCSSAFERIPIFSEAFTAFIGRCTEYGGFLSKIKKQYDEAITEGMKVLRQHQRLELISDNSMEYLTHIVSAEKVAFEAQVREKDRKIKETQDTMAAQLANFSKMIEEHHDLKTKNAQLERLVEELELKSRVLIDGLKQETLHRSLMVQQGKKLKSDNEKLQKKAQLLEFKMKNDALLQSTEMPSAQQPLVPSSSLSSNRDASPSSQLRRGDASPLGTSKKNASGSGFGDEGDGGGGLDERTLVLHEKVRRLLQLLHRERSEKKALQDQLEGKSTTRIDRPLTPRPTWSLCRGILPRWNVPSRQPSVDILQEFIKALKDRLREDRKDIEVRAMSETIRNWFRRENMCESDLVRQRSQTFVGRGMGPSVPVYLKFHGLLRNRQLAKGDVEQMLKDFWKDRVNKTTAASSSDETVLGPPLSIQDFFFDWLVRTTGNATSATELAYNIVDVCSRYTSDPDCGMFLAILNNEVHETAYFDQMSVIEQLQMVMRHHDKRDLGLLKRTRIHHILLKVFPAKSVDSMLKLRFALLSHYNPSNDTIRYLEVFEEDSDGNQSRFVELVREQHLREMTEYIVDIEEAIRNAASSDGDGLDVTSIRTAIRFLDPNIPPSNLDAIISCGLGSDGGVTNSSPSDLLHTTGGGGAIDAEDFIRRIRRGVLLMPYTRRDVDAADVDDTLLLMDEDEAAEMDYIDLDDGDVDESTAAALQALDKHLYQAAERIGTGGGGRSTGGDCGGGGASTTSGGSGGAKPSIAVALPSVAENAMKLLKTTTTDGLHIHRSSISAKPTGHHGSGAATGARGDTSNSAT